METRTFTCGRRSSIADFFVKPNIAVYCDGTYWHSKRSRIERDRHINKVLKENNYMVLRLSEKEIMDDSGKDKLLEIANGDLDEKFR